MSSEKRMYVRACSVLSYKQLQYMKNYDLFVSIFNPEIIIKWEHKILIFFYTIAINDMIYS